MIAIDAFKRVQLEADARRPDPRQDHRTGTCGAAVGLNRHAAWIRQDRRGDQASMPLRDQDGLVNIAHSLRKRPRIACPRTRLSSPRGRQRSRTVRSTFGALGPRLDVQAFMPEHNGDSRFETVTGPACVRLHVIDGVTGSVLVLPRSAEWIGRNGACDEEQPEADRAATGRDDDALWRKPSWNIALSGPLVFRLFQEKQS